MGRVDDDFEVVVQLLSDVPPQFGGNDSFRIRVRAKYAEVNIMFVVENADFSLLRWNLSFERFALQKIVDRAC